MDFNKGIERISLARQQGGYLVLVSPVSKRLERCHTFIGKAFIAFHLSELDQFNGSAFICVDFLDGRNGSIKAAAFAHHLFGLLRIVPQLGILDARVQFIKPAQCTIPVERHLDEIKGGVDPFDQGLRIGAHGETPISGLMSGCGL